MNFEWTTSIAWILVILILATAIAFMVMGASNIKKNLTAENVEKHAASLMAGQVVAGAGVMLSFLIFAATFVNGTNEDGQIGVMIAFLLAVLFGLFGALFFRPAIRAEREQIKQKLRERDEELDRQRQS